MSKQATGLAFIAIAAFLFGVMHLAEAIYKASDLALNAVAYKELGESGRLLLILAAISAVLGAHFLIRGLLSKRGVSAD